MGKFVIMNEMKFSEDQLEMLLNFGFRLCGNLDDARDLVQEAIFRLLRKRDSVSNPTAYIRKTMVNLFIDERRKKIIPLNIRELPEVTIPDNTKIIHVQNCLDKLTRIQRVVVVLFYMEGYKTSEIAGEIGISQGTVKTHLFRAREKLRNCLEGYL